ncbi:MAG: CtsR family transcriptional regulator [Finegoldia sp.]|nr:CtsR family transcriptional regulator [Finegoldia sp.]
MAGLSNEIELFLKNLLQKSDQDYIEIGRNELANRFNCAPSQINYVLTTRFTPYKGYYIESRRGGRGYIKIIKLQLEEMDSVDKLIADAIGDSITKDKSKNLIKAMLDEKLMTEREALLISHAIEDKALTRVAFDKRNEVRADILKNVLLAYLR